MSKLEARPTSGVSLKRSLPPKKITRREKFLARMETLIPWTQLLAVIEPFHPKGQRGRPPVGLKRTLRVYFLQQRYGLADEAIEDVFYDSHALQSFARIDLVAEGVPYATTLLQFADCWKPTICARGSSPPSMPT
jgi:IS5 family transposase